MSTAQGTIRPGNDRLTAIFENVEGSARILSIEVSAHIPFDVPNAQLKYNFIDDLEGSHRCEGSYSDEKIEIKLDNGVLISGKMPVKLGSEYFIGGAEWTGH